MESTNCFNLIQGMILDFRVSSSGVENCFDDRQSSMQDTKKKKENHKLVSSLVGLDAGESKSIKKNMTRRLIEEDIGKKRNQLHVTLPNVPIVDKSRSRWTLLWQLFSCRKATTVAIYAKQKVIEDKRRNLCPEVNSNGKEIFNFIYFDTLKSSSTLCKPTVGYRLPPQLGERGMFKPHADKLDCKQRTNSKWFRILSKYISLISAK